MTEKIYNFNKTMDSSSSIPFLSPPATLVEAADVPTMSEYELLRLENIRRNTSYLKSLGLADGVNSTQNAPLKNDFEEKRSVKKRSKITRGVNVDVGDASDRRKSKRIQKISPQLSILMDELCT